jgi:DNA repair exonuclease SbcCD ATPase subunit
MNLTNKEPSTEEEKKMFEEKLNLENIILQSEKEKENISKNLEKNINMKQTLKKLLLKFISNTQMKEINDLQRTCNGFINDKRELEVKNKKYQEFLSAVLKEKDEKDAKITELKNDLEKTKKKINQKDKKILDCDKKIRELEEKIKEQKILIMQNKNNPIKNLSKSTNIRGRSLNDDTELRTITKKFFTGSMSGSKNNRSNKHAETSTVNIDLSTKGTSSYSLYSPRQCIFTNSE